MLFVNCLIITTTFVLFIYTYTGNQIEYVISVPIYVYVWYQLYNCLHHPDNI